MEKLLISEKSLYRHLREMYVEAAHSMAFAAVNTETHEERYRAELYGRRQAIGTVLKNLYGVSDYELQEIIDAQFKKVQEELKK